MMETQRITLLCKLRSRRVEVLLGQEPHAAHHPGIPEGWSAQSCLGRNTECYNKGCPFTVEEDVQDSMRWPFTASKSR